MIIARIAIPINAIDPQMFRDSCSPERNALWMISSPIGLSITAAASSAVIHGHRVLSFMRMLRQGDAIADAA